MTLLEIDYTKPIESVADKLSFGGQMVLIGMSVVFAVLIILWGALELFHLIVTKVPAMIEKKKAKAEAPAAEDAAGKVVPVAAVAAEAEDDGELVAVFAAAIAAASSENPAGSFRVVSFRRV